MSDTVGAVASAFLFVFMIAVWAYAIFDSGRNTGRDEIKAEAIERGFAEYDSKTAQWKWKE